MTEINECGVKTTQCEDGTWCCEREDGTCVRAPTLGELRQALEAAPVEAPSEAALVQPATGPWDAVRAWVAANPWAVSVGVVGVAGFAALALWLVFNAVFG